MESKQMCAKNFNGMQKNLKCIHKYRKACTSTQIMIHLLKVVKKIGKCREKYAK